MPITMADGESRVVEASARCCFRPAGVLGFRLAGARLNLAAGSGLVLHGGYAGRGLQAMRGRVGADENDAGTGRKLVPPVA